MNLSLFKSGTVMFCESAADKEAVKNAREYVHLAGLTANTAKIVRGSDYVNVVIR